MVLILICYLTYISQYDKNTSLPAQVCRRKMFSFSQVSYYFSISYVLRLFPWTFFVYLFATQLFLYFPPGVATPSTSILTPLLLFLPIYIFSYYQIAVIPCYSRSVHCSIPAILRSADVIMFNLVRNSLLPFSLFVYQ